MATRTTKNGSSTKDNLDAVALLKADHRAVEELFEKYEATRGSTNKAKLAQQICLELTIHATIEEETFIRPFAARSMMI